MTILIKNISSNLFTDPQVNDLGTSIPLGGSLVLELEERLPWAVSASSGDALTEIVSGKLVINNNSIDLPSSLGLNFLLNFSVDLSSSLSASNTSISKSNLEQLVTGGSADGLHTHNFSGEIEPKSYSYTYDSEERPTTITSYSSLTQTIANRLRLGTISYNSEDQPVLAVCQSFDPNDGTTVIKTETITYTWVGDDLLKTEIVVT